MIEPYPLGRAGLYDHLKRPKGRPWPIAASIDALHVAFVQKEVRVPEVEVTAPSKQDLLVALGKVKHRPLLLHEKERNQPRRH